MMRSLPSPAPTPMRKAAGLSAHALLGERAEALRYLRRSIAAREPLALTLRPDPLLRNLHGDPEFHRPAAGIGRSAPPPG